MVTPYSGSMVLVQTTLNNHSFKLKKHAENRVTFIAFQALNMFTKTV
jgi:hypothetical protein